MRERQGDDPPCARPAEGLGACLERRAGRPDVVDEEHVRVNRPRGPDPGRIGEPLPASAAHLTLPASSSQAPIEWQPGLLCHRNGDLLSGVEARRAHRQGPACTGTTAPASSCGGRARSIAVAATPASEQPAAVLEAVHQPTGGAVERRGCNREVHPGRTGSDHPWRTGQFPIASMAQHHLRSTARATGRAQRRRGEGEAIDRGRVWVSDHLPPGKCEGALIAKQ